MWHYSWCEIWFLELVVAFDVLLDVIEIILAYCII